MADSQTTTGPFIVFDVETTGFKPEDGHEILEIGAEKLSGREVIEQFHALLIAEKPIPAEATRIHGITDEMLQKEGKPPEEIIPSFLSFIMGGVIVGHNIGFDMNFLRAYAQKLSLPVPQNRTLDTCEIARRQLIIPSYTLERVATYFGIPHPNAHRALADVAVTREVFFKLLDRALQQKRGSA